MNLSDAQLFFGHVSPAEARAYVRIPSAAPPSQFVGTIAGPRCAYSSTLQARIPLRAASSGDGVLLEAVVPDPCFWTPELPFLYDVKITHQAGDSEDSFAGVIGFRPLATLDRQLRYAGRNWVLRAANAGSVAESSLDAWHEQELAMVVESPLDVLCQQASELGVLLIATIGPGVSQPEAELRRLARWPAVGFLLLESTGGTNNVRRLAPNVIVASRYGSAPVEGWDLLLTSETDALRAMAGFDGPVVVERKIGSPVSIEAARQACDLLQRDVAEMFVGEEVAARPAGYIV